MKYIRKINLEQIDRVTGVNLIYPDCYRWKTPNIIRVPNSCFSVYFFRVPKSPKWSIFLGLGLSSTFGTPPHHMLMGVPPPGPQTGKYVHSFGAKFAHWKRMKNPFLGVKF